MRSAAAGTSERAAAPADPPPLRPASGDECAAPYVRSGGKRHAWRERVRTLGYCSWSPTHITHHPSPLRTTVSTHPTPRTRLRQTTGSRRDDRQGVHAQACGAAPAPSSRRQRRRMALPHECRGCGPTVIRARRRRGREGGSTGGRTGGREGGGIVAERARLWALAGAPPAGRPPTAMAYRGPGPMADILP